nr:MAG TPA: hypothetical protein [Caudoviricetes sp.]
MEVKYNLTGPARKALVKAIENIIGEKAIYKKVPSCAYTVEGYTITKEGTLQWDEHTDVSAAKLLVKRLADAGFAAEDFQIESIEPDKSEPIEEGLCIQIPKSSISDFELDLMKKMIAGKASLIKKATGASNLDVEIKDDVVCFPWFDALPDPEMIRAVSVFITRLATFSREIKRVTASEREVENERYAFRCFLLRLGFIGDEYKSERKTLLKNLSGSSAFRNGHKKKDK